MEHGLPKFIASHATNNDYEGHGYVLANNPIAPINHVRDKIDLPTGFIDK